MVTAVMLVDTFGGTENIRQQHNKVVLTLHLHIPSSHWMKVKEEKEEYMSGSMHQQADPEAGQSLSSGQLQCCSISTNILCLQPEPI